MKKISFKEFLKNYNIVLSYAIKHMVNEDWNKYDEGLFIDDIFDTMQYYVLAGKKCQDYEKMFKEYEKMDKRTRGCIFLDEK